MEGVRVDRAVNCLMINEFDAREIEERDPVLAARRRASALKLIRAEYPAEQSKAIVNMAQETMEQWDRYLDSLGSTE